MVEKAGMIFSPNWEWVVGKLDGKYAGDIIALGTKNVERVIEVEEESDAVYLVRCLNACGAMAITMGDIERAARGEREALCGRELCGVGHPDEEQRGYVLRPE